MIKPAIALLGPLLLARVGCSEEIKSIVLSKKEAITIAEKFVAAQGYTGKFIAHLNTFHPNTQSALAIIPDTLCNVTRSAILLV